MSENGNGADSADAKPEELRPLRDNPIEAFRMGACFDMRVRFAMELLTHSPIYAGAFQEHRGNQAEGENFSPNYMDIASHAFYLASSLFDIAEEEHMVGPLGEVDEHMKAHIRRQIDFENAVAKERQRQADEAARLPRAVAGAFRKDN